MAEANKPTDGPMGETWILFRPLASDIPDAIRFRAMLKAALRTHGLKAVRVSGVGPGPEVEREGAARGTDQGIEQL
jgi:hypothetical protein